MEAYDKKVFFTLTISKCTVDSVEDIHTVVYFVCAHPHSVRV